MEVAARIVVDAPPERVWKLWTDVERWPDWTASVLRIEPLDGPLRIGARFRIRQPRLPALVWEVDALEEGRSWSWVAHSAGAVTIGRHVISADPRGALTEQLVVHRGWLGVPVGWMMQRTTRRYLAMEGEGLKRLAEGAA